MKNFLLWAGFHYFRTFGPLEIEGWFRKKLNLPEPDINSWI